MLWAQLTPCASFSLSLWERARVRDVRHSSHPHPNLLSLKREKEKSGNLYIGLPN